MTEREAPDTPGRIRTLTDRAARDGVDWWTWRIVVSADIPDGLADIRQRWSFADLLDAHIVLDTMEAARAVAAEYAGRPGRG